jgi:Ca-activated chloride channel family protein
VALALIQAPAHARSSGTGDIAIESQFDRGVMRAGEGQRAYLKILIGAKRRDAIRRAPMNIALVIDRSGSMSSQGRIENARQAAAMAVDRLGRDDIFSVVSYDDRVEVEVPATKLTSPETAKDRIRRLSPRGSTAIHAGLLAGAEELRKFKSRDRVNRIILLSDGLANVGPSQPRDFTSLGRELASEGMTVSTIGLGTGYNEDLMAGLARAADGSHVFVQESADLANFLAREFDDALGIFAQDVEIIITLKDGVKPIRSLGRDAKIEGSRIVYKVGALMSGASQILLSEIEIPASAAIGETEIASVEVAYVEAQTGTRATASSKAVGRFDQDHAAADKSINAGVMADVTTLVSREARAEAVRLRDAGRADEAVKKFKDNVDFIRRQQTLLPGLPGYAPLDNELRASEAAASPAARSSDGWAKARKEQRATDSNVSGGVIKY